MWSQTTETILRSSWALPLWANANCKCICIFYAAFSPVWVIAIFFFSITIFSPLYFPIIYFSITILWGSLPGRSPLVFGLAGSLLTTISTIRPLTSPKCAVSLWLWEMTKATYITGEPSWYNNKQDVGDSWKHDSPHILIRQTVYEKQQICSEVFKCRLWPSPPKKNLENTK